MLILGDDYTQLMTPEMHKLATVTMEMTVMNKEL
jgi:hypothetical protein